MTSIDTGYDLGGITPGHEGGGIGGSGGGGGGAEATAWASLAAIAPWADPVSNPDDIPANYHPLQYRKVGDIVYLRGWVTALDVTGGPICQMPEGARPPGSLDVVAVVSTTIGGLNHLTVGAEDSAAGVVTLAYGFTSETDHSVGGETVMLDGVFFSVTA